MPENKSSFQKSLLIVTIILFSLIFALSITIYFSSVKKSLPVTIQPIFEPTITPTLTLTPTPTPTPTPIFSPTPLSNEAIDNLISKYSDADFGISFYYPKAWKISKENTSDTGTFSPITEEKNLFYLLGIGGPEVDDIIVIAKYSGQRVEDSDAKFGNVAYYYDKNTNKWMSDLNTDIESYANRPVEPAFYTLSGFPVFRGTGRWLTNIVAISTDKFLIINSGGSGFTEYLDPLTKTVINTGISVDNKKLKDLEKQEICLESSGGDYTKADSCNELK